MAFLHLVTDTASALGMSSSEFDEWRILEQLTVAAQETSSIPDMTPYESARYGTLADKIDTHAARRNDSNVYMNYPDCFECGNAWGSATTCSTCLDGQGERRELWERLRTVLAKSRSGSVPRRHRTPLLYE